MSRTPTFLKLIAAVFLGCSAPAAADDIRVLSAGAIEPGIAAAASAFERDTGHKVLITFDTAPRIRARVNAGEQWGAFVRYLGSPAGNALFQAAGIEPIR